MFNKRVFVIALSFSATANAYTYQSAVSNGCHERLAIAAIRSVRQTLPTQAVIVAPSADERALIDDVPFDLNPDVKDLSGATLAIGVRDNDLKGRGPDELDSLAQVHGNPSTQREHCLRGPTEDEPNGTQSSIEDCKAFIREKVTFALDGLDPKGVPDPSKRTELLITLTFRGHTSASLPQFWFAIGQAMHTLEDSFTHNFRSADHLKIHVAENYSDYVENNFVEGRDGPAHRSEMDECEDLDAYRQKNWDLATQASIDLLHLTLDPTMTRDQKLAALETTMNTYLTYEPGCTDANHWCNAQENGYNVDAGCSVTGRRVANSFVALSALGVAAIALLARRRRTAAVAALGLLIAYPSTAAAQEEPAPEPPKTEHEVKATEAAAAAEKAPDVDPAKATPGTLTKTEAKAEQKNEEHLSRFAIFGGTTASLSNPSVNGQLGFRVNLTEHWQVGLDGEINGWYGSVVKKFSAGAFNTYATVVFRTPLRFAPINLRSTGNIGVATQLVDLYGSPSGSTGIFLGISPLGIEYKLSSRVYLIASGLSIALPITKLTGGAPFAYSQYREAIGVEISL